MSVLIPSFAERKRVWVFRRCTLSLFSFNCFMEQINDDDDDDELMIMIKWPT